MIQKEKAKLLERAKKHKKSKAAAAPTEDSDSDSDMEVSVNLIEEISHSKKHHLEDEPNPDFDKSEEEKAYLQHIHAEVDAEFPLIED